MLFDTAIRLQKSAIVSIMKLMCDELGATLKETFSLNEEESILLFALREDEYIEALGRLLQKKADKGYIISFFMAPAPMRVLTICVLPGIYQLLKSDLQKRFEISPDTVEMSLVDVTLVYHFPWTQDITDIEEVLKRKQAKGHIIEYSLDPLEDEEPGEITLADLEEASDEMDYLSSCIDSKNIFEPDIDLLNVAKCAIYQSMQLMKSSTYPHPLVELPAAPSLLFPIKNSTTESTIWLEVSASGSVLTIIVHKTKPDITNSSQCSYATAMAGVYLEYHVHDHERSQELLQVLLHDEKDGPYNEAHWDLPGVLNTTQDIPIVLVDNVQAWEPAQESAEA